MKNVIFDAWPHFSADEIRATVAVLESGKVNYWTGEEGRNFEKDFAKYVGCEYGIALANGTVALELALHGLGLKPGDEVIVPSRTFIATASAVVMCGGVPVCADIDPDSQNITADSIAAVATTRTRGVIPVHLAGWPCEMDKIMALAESHNWFVIEDCAQAHGASYKGKMLGSWGHAAAFSFCQDKIMTTGGEGGILVTNSEPLWRSAWAFKDHGKSFDAVNRPDTQSGFRWVHESFGTNWRMTEIQSAIGRLALRKLPQWIEHRRHNAQQLNTMLSGQPGLRLTIPDKQCHHAYYKYYVFVRPEKLKPGWTRDRIMQEILDAGVPCFSGSCSEIYLEKAFQSAAFAPKERHPNAAKLGDTSLMFLVHPTLSESAIFHTAEVVRNVVSQAAS